MERGNRRGWGLYWEEVWGGVRVLTRPSVVGEAGRNLEPALNAGRN